MKQTIEHGPVFEQILKQLTRLKYQPKFIESIVPSWWTPEAEASPNGLEHLKLLLAQYLGLDAAILLRDGIVKPVVPHDMKLKCCGTPSTRLSRPSPDPKQKRSSTR